MSAAIDWAKLQEPFRPEDLEWKISTTWAKDGKPGAKCLAYMTARAVMDRLDEVVGPENWRVSYHHDGGALTCTLAIRIEGEWLEKQDGAGIMGAGKDGHLDSADAGKADFSNALKRAAVTWGIGRYLYRLPEAWAKISPNGSNYGKTSQKTGSISFRWDPPSLPAWAVPSGSSTKAPPGPPNVDPATGEIFDEGPNHEDESQDPGDTEDLQLVKTGVKQLLDKVAADPVAQKMITLKQADDIEALLGTANLERLQKSSEWLGGLLDEASKVGVR